MEEHCFCLSAISLPKKPKNQGDLISHFKAQDTDCHHRNWGVFSSVSLGPIRVPGQVLPVWSYLLVVWWGNTFNEVGKLGISFAPQQGIK